MPKSIYSIPHKRSFLKYGQTSLEVQQLRDGTLDVDVETGKVYRTLPLVSDPPDLGVGVRVEKAQRPDDDGYMMVDLCKERADKRGGRQAESHEAGRKPRVRYRTRRTAMVHRIVKIKAIAVALGGANWRMFVKDLPPGIDVNHLNLKRDDNHHKNLELRTELGNRSKQPMTDAEWEEIRKSF